MLENSAPVPQTALPRVNQSAKWNSRIIEKRLRESAGISRPMNDQGMGRPMMKMAQSARGHGSSSISYWPPRRKNEGVTCLDLPPRLDNYRFGGIGPAL